MSNFLTPKRHILARDRVVWAIARKNPPKGLTCRWVSEKKIYGYKNFCVYFTHLPGSPPWRDLHEILHEGSSRRRNQQCQILFQSDQGFWFCGGSNFWLSHKKEKSPLTQGLNYRSACDKTLSLGACWWCILGMFWWRSPMPDQLQQQQGSWTSVESTDASSTCLLQVLIYTQSRN